MGIALLTFQSLEAFSQTGFQAALIQKKRESRDYLNDAWTILLLRGFFLCSIIVLSAPNIANFFKTAEALPIIRVIGLIFLIQGFINIDIISFRKELNFKKQYLFEISGFVSDFLISIVLVFLIRNVWALVVGKLVGETARLIASYSLSKFRPKLSFCWQKIRELHFFGRWISWVNTMVFLVTQGDSILVGRMFGPISLGVYKLASTISNLPVTEITHVVSELTFPAYALFQDDRVRLRKAVAKTFKATFVLSAIVSLMIFLFIEAFATHFLGEKWLSIIPLTRILVIAGFIRSIQAIPGAFFYAIGKPHIDTSAQVVRLISFVFLILLLFRNFELFGVALSVLGSILLTAFFSYYHLMRLLWKS